MERNRNEWNDEYRRAYDRGYWDARREMDRHMERHHRDDDDHRGRRSYQGSDDVRSRGDRRRGEYGGAAGWRSHGRDHDRGEGFRRYGRGDHRDYDSGDHRYRDDDRGFFEKAGDEVRSWFGDDEAERRRRFDERRERGYDRYRDDDDRYDRDRNWW